MREQTKPKTISDQKLKFAANLVDKTVEPKVKMIVEELNKILARQGIRAGCELQWYFDEVTTP